MKDTCFDCNKVLDVHKINYCGDCVDKIAEQRNIYFIQLDEIEEVLENTGYITKAEVIKKITDILKQTDKKILGKGHKIREGGGVQGTNQK